MEPTYTGERAVGATIGGSNQKEYTLPIEQAEGRHDLYLIFKVTEGERYAPSTAIMEWVQFNR